jgi:hypothetical protein
MQLGDSAIHPASQPEVVGIYDETAHRVSLSALGHVVVLHKVSAAQMQARCYDDSRPESAFPPRVGG